MEILLILVAILLLFGYKKLPDASRSIGRSLRIFKGEMKGLHEDDVRTVEPAGMTPGRGADVPPLATWTSPGAASAEDSESSARLIEEAPTAETHAAELRAGPARAGTT
jgi:sec-independent protein translocase protein TatA